VSGRGRDGGPPAEEAVVIPLTGELDLHPFSPRDIPSVVEEYVRACAESGVQRLRLAHGRGRGVQRAVVRRVLSSLPEVHSFADAPAGAGGWGATVVELHVEAPHGPERQRSPRDR
jgi:DNA-nicking Smr family endonuclease